MFNYFNLEISKPVQCNLSLVKNKQILSKIFEL